MANLPETSTYEAGIYQFETTDPVLGGPDGIDNLPNKQLANRTKYLKDQVDALSAALTALSGGIDEDAMNALWGGMLQAIADAGLANREFDAQRFTRHQSGEVTIYNRGVKSGCAASKSATATRNLNLAAGTIFMHGREFGVIAQTNGASVPSNDGASSAVCYAYLILSGSSIDLACTNLGDSVPEDGMALYQVTVPAGNTDVSDPYLANCTLTSIARSEPNWPTVQSSPAYADVTLPRRASAVDYQVLTDVMAYEGGEAPNLLFPLASRAVNTFRIYLGGMADAVNFRWLMHRMAN